LGVFLREQAEHKIPAGLHVEEVGHTAKPTESAAIP